MTPTGPPFSGPAVEAAFAAHPEPLATALLRLRGLIFDTAAGIGELGGLVETIKWGQPAYLPARARVGTTVRIDAVKGDPGAYALYFHCRTTLAETFEELYADRLHFDGKRALIFSAGAPLPEEAARHCIALALTYHARSRWTKGLLNSRIPEDGRILFFERDRKAFGFLSHFHPAIVALDGEVWPTVEHYYQSRKSADPHYRAAIRAAVSPGHAKRLADSPGRSRKSARQSWFRETGNLPRPDWDTAKADIMRRADLAKYAQNRDLRELLCATGDAEIVKDSPHDAFWGIGRDALGENWAGRILMEVRARLCDGVG